MIVRALDNTGDWQFGKSLQSYKRNLDAVVQNISTRLYMFLNDCFFAKSQGIDWFNLLGTKNEIGVSLAVSSTISNTDFVTGILQLSINLNSDRVLTIIYNASTSFGQTQSQAINFSVPNYLLTQSGDTLVTESGDPIII